MRSSIVTLIVLLLSISSAVPAFIPLDLLRNLPISLDGTRAEYRKELQDKMQAPMNPGPVQPDIPEIPGDKNTGDGGALTISDILPKTRNINIFASLTRDISSVTCRLESNNPKDNTTLLAPLNSAMQALPRKPWEDRPGDYAKEGSDEDRAARNLQRFVEMHIIPISPWKEGKENKMKSLGGQELWWEKRDDKRVIMPGDLEVDSIVGTVGNGEVWAVKGVVNYQ